MCGGGGCDIYGECGEGWGCDVGGVVRGTRGYDVVSRAIRIFHVRKWAG